MQKQLLDTHTDLEVNYKGCKAKYLLGVLEATLLMDKVIYLGIYY